MLVFKEHRRLASYVWAIKLLGSIYTKGKSLLSSGCMTSQTLDILASSRLTASHDPEAIVRTYTGLLLRHLSYIVIRWVYGK